MQMARSEWLKGDPQVGRPVQDSVLLSSHEREFCIDNLLVRIHFVVVMIRWTGLAPWEFDFPF